MSKVSKMKKIVRQKFLKNKISQLRTCEIFLKKEI